MKGTEDKKDVKDTKDTTKDTVAKESAPKEVKDPDTVAFDGMIIFLKCYCFNLMKILFLRSKREHKIFGKGCSN